MLVRGTRNFKVSGSSRGLDSGARNDNERYPSIFAAGIQLEACEKFNTPPVSGSRGARQSKGTYPAHLHESARRSKSYPSRPPGREIKRISLIIHLVEAGSRWGKKEQKGGEDRERKITIIGRPVERNTRGRAQIAVSSNKPTECKFAPTGWNGTALSVYSPFFPFFLREGQSGPKVSVTRVSQQ